MKKTSVIAAVLMVAVLTGILPLTTVYADINNAPIYADDTSNTNVESNNEQSIASGVNVNAQNCSQNNIDSTNTAGDEEVYCHNNQAEATEAAASD
jgi:hypothetical protein